MTSGGERRLVVAVLTVAVLVGAVAPALLTVGIDGSRQGIAAGAKPGAGGPALAAVTPTDNGSTRHENPDEVGDDGDLEDVQGWLLGRISGRLEGSAINISQGQYDAAAGALDNETRSYLDRFIDVAGDTESEEDDRTAETINETVAEQRDFGRTRRNYSETYEAYLEARENGNISRARRLARQLTDLERRLDQTGSNLTRNYRAIGNRTGINTAAEQAALNQTVQNVSELQAEIRRDLFVETRVVIESATPNASVLDPLVVRGRVVTENGTPVTAGVIRLQGGPSATATLNATGHFTLRHRPVLLPRGSVALMLGYRPPATSQYLGSTSEIKVTIQGREPTLELTDVPDVVGFGETLAVGARVTVGNHTIEGVPIDATLGEESLRPTTTANGTVTLSGTVPAGLDDGQRALRVTLPVSGRAIASTNATRTVRVRKTETRLGTEVTALSPTRLRVRGRLETVDGAPVPDQPVRVAIGSEGTGGALTNDTGAFAVTLTIPESIDPSEFEDRRVPVNATFAEPATNLEASSAGRAVTVPSGPLGDKGGLLGLGFPWWAWAALLVLTLFVSVVTYAVLSWREQPSEDASGGSTAVTETGSSSGKGGEETDVSPSLLAVATEHLDAGAADAATAASYEAVRQRLAERLGVVAGTHWELYQACQTAGWPDDRVAAIRRLTEVYEQAAFAPGSLPGETAREALTTARDLLEDEDSVASGD